MFFLSEMLDYSAIMLVVMLAQRLSRSQMNRPGNFAGKFGRRQEREKGSVVGGARSDLVGAS